MKLESVETSEPCEGVGFGIEGKEAAAFELKRRGDMDDVVRGHSSPAMMRLKRSSSHSPGFGGTKPASIMRCSRTFISASHAVTGSTFSFLLFGELATFGVRRMTSPERLRTSTRPYFRMAASTSAVRRLRSLRVKVTGGLMSDTECLTLVRDQADNYS